MTKPPRLCTSGRLWVVLGYGLATVALVVLVVLIAADSSGAPGRARGGGHRRPRDAGQADQAVRNRTGVALAVNAALLARTSGGSLVRHLPAAAMLIVALGCFLLADRRYRRITAAVRAGRSVASIAHLRTLAAVAVLPAVIALAGALVP